MSIVSLVSFSLSAHTEVEVELPEAQKSFTAFGMSLHMFSISRSVELISIVSGSDKLPQILLPILLHKADSEYVPLSLGLTRYVNFFGTLGV